MLAELDKELFFAINGWHSPFCDHVMWILTKGFAWTPLYIALIVEIFIHFKKRGFIIILFTLLGLGISDLVSVHIFKDIFLRYRPSNDPAIMNMVHIVNNYRGGLYGFISSHAANTFMIAVFTLLVVRKWHYSIIILCWALLMCYTRVYLGVHYPGDILAGALVGTILAVLWNKVWQITDRKIVNRFSWWQKSSKAGTISFLWRSKK